MLLRDTLRRAFWLPSAVAIVGGVVLAYALREFDAQANPSVGLFAFEDFDSARGMLSTIAGATVSVAGLSFSVTIVALQLASSQLSPRVLTTFREDRVAQATLASFLGVFAYSVVLLARLTSGDGNLPQVALLVAVLGALMAFSLFVAFIGRTVAALQASNVIRRIAEEGGRAQATAHPTGVGGAPADPDAARSAAERLVQDSDSVPLTARRAGFLLNLSDQLIERARAADALVVQRREIGEFIVAGEVVAVAHLRDGPDEATAERLERCFSYGEERTPSGDIAFPVRALTDVALRALSPSLNDPTTAENALGSLTQTLLLFARTDPAADVRVDADGQPRLWARAPGLEDLVILGFEQVRLMVADEHPTTAARLISWLEEIARAGDQAGMGSRQARRQIELLRPTAAAAPSAR